nr:amidohydrolase [uncultured Anaerococcus sp.]
MIALHINSALELGTASIQEGPIKASADTFKIEIIGQGGHGSEPDLTIDPIAIGSLIVQNLQNIASREVSPINPMVLSITSFNSGNSENVIPDKAKLLGTTRTFDNDLREKFPEIIERIVKGICESNRAKYNFEYYFGTPATVNDEESAKLGYNVLKDIIGEEKIIHFKARMSGEDFAKYLLEIPGALMFLGAKVEGDSYPHHNSKFIIDERALKIGSEYFINYTKKYFEL